MIDSRFVILAKVIPEETRALKSDDDDDSIETWPPGLIRASVVSLASCETH